MQLAEMFRKLAFLTLTLAPVLPARAAAQDAPSAPPAHQHHHTGLPELRPIPEGAIYTAADVEFLQGMIAHHAQAIEMSRLAESRGADSRLLRFARKIDQSQESEIRMMQGWLVDHGQAIPDSASYRTITMPGMLTAAEMQQLAAARGREFDRLFLELMIKHHEGAIGMVADLLASPGAAQDVDVNVFATDVEIVQTAEIDLMHQMLADLQGDP
jgi:uncharacterized protein (DUF305 family)